MMPKLMLSKAEFVSADHKRLDRAVLTAEKSEDLSRVALVTGFTGQDGTYLSQHLLNLGYTVVGLVRRVSSEPPQRIRGGFDFSSHLASGKLILEPGDLTSVASLCRIFDRYHFDEVYNLAAQSDVRISFDQPELTFATNALGVQNLLTAIECSRQDPKIYQASTSELFGNATQDKQNERTPLAPVSPYGISKLAAHRMIAAYRDAGHYACSGILFNHESPIRGGGFVTMKIVRAVVQRKLWEKTQIGEPPILMLGNLNARRDWGYAGDYVWAMHLMLQQEKPQDFVIATGETHSVREFLFIAMEAAGLADFSIQEVGTEREKTWIPTPNGDIFTMIDPKLYRPVDVFTLCGDAKLARKELHWRPTVSFKELVGLMVAAEMFKYGLKP